MQLENATRTCNIDWQQVHTAWRCSMNMQCGHDNMDMQHWQSSKNKQFGHTVWTCNRDPQHGQPGNTAWKFRFPFQKHAEWTFSKDMTFSMEKACSTDILHGHATREAVLTCSLDMQPWHAPWTCSQDMPPEHAVWEIQHEYVLWACSKDMHMEM